MKAIARLFNPLRTAVTAFFRHDLALKRAEGGVHIVLEQRPRAGTAVAAKPKTKAPSREDKAHARDAQELALMREQLAALLDQMPESRTAMRHLVFVEQALRKKGLRSFQKLPLEVLQRSLDQLEGLVTNWSPAGLASLRSRLAVAILDREHANPDAEADAYRTAAVLDPHDGRAVTATELTPDDEVLAAAYAALDTGPAPLDVPEDLAAAYAALDLGEAAPSEFEMQGDLSSPSARALAREAARPQPRHGEAGDIELRELQG